MNHKQCSFSFVTIDVKKVECLPSLPVDISPGTDNE